MANILQVPCDAAAPSTAKNACNGTITDDISEFRSSMLAALAPLTSNPKNGGYLSACVQHCHQNIAQVWAQELVQNATVEDTFWAWWTGNASAPHLVIDGDYRTNQHCFGVPYSCEAEGAHA
jgi:hypothetical protein